MIVEVTDQNITLAAEIHSLSWKDSHKDFCSASFIEEHSVKRQEAYLQNEMQSGKSFIC